MQHKDEEASVFIQTIESLKIENERLSGELETYSANALRQIAKLTAKISELEEFISRNYDPSKDGYRGKDYNLWLEIHKKFYPENY